MLFGVNTIKGFRQCRKACLRNKWKYCAAFEGWGDLDIVFRRELNKPLNARARASGPWPS